MPEVEVNGTRLFYQQSGEGPDVVLVHAVTSNQAVWVFSGLVEALAADFRVTAYDMRGHGASARPATGYTSAVMAEDFRQFHAALGLKPAFLVGHSFGGVVSMHAAVVAPECVAGVLLSDSFFPGLKHIEPNFGKMGIWGDVRETFARVGVELGDTVDFTRLFRETAALSPEKMKELEDIYGAFGRGWLRQLPRLAETTCGDEVLAEAGLTEPVLAGLTKPVVALYDEFSPFLATCRWLEQHLAKCTVEIIPAAKHLAMLDNTAGFTDAVKRHLTRLSQ
ncbi:alpha beta hydrolase : Putative hydrolase or acyltransferase of alpha/beta superfamily OS=Singulisphaera acidiphila (strain ATCC BAA-1392 / DSM 18658 / VKM B-2454 / MOB10) GN=Sinac_5567 PE=4 SV=1: Abhydrolase_6 [Gemmata massiliana]|uniref:AB hydrolase-1 domain-containing protein n=1 Tax=Gemmata massiliana TaxID=1210884 RepID=A0A6P2CX55_9BACT|nr:alpha/beta hydrolase [Gemmata massiliana]VTR92304.1 alpha beta hydrolase : Putative hydrolase or acyltransferase of alpha/beta superfamily OS=Singulisphaera acidiphila (strain ATCC BAA-1392 / DSM 18658 / VKM B-2454 / MOB10) GN=Sinac_5567 PE=4 SV=1: Abhydrolase_6 [Gemmata massiliana]